MSLILSQVGEEVKIKKITNPKLFKNFFVSAFPVIFLILTSSPTCDNIYDIFSTPHTDNDYHYFTIIILLYL